MTTLSKITRKTFYQKLKAEGRYGYFKDPTWSKKRHMHMCCKSKARWYHRVGCPAARGDFDLKGVKVPRSKLYLKIKKLKAKGKNSGEIAKILSIPLSKVNDIFSR